MIVCIYIETGRPHPGDGSEDIRVYASKRVLSLANATLMACTSASVAKRRQPCEAGRLFSRTGPLVGSEVTLPTRMLSC